MHDLAIRLTHTYVGTYQHLDKWQSVGSFDELGRRELPLTDEEADDCCDPQRHEVFCLVRFDEEAALAFRGERYCNMPRDQWRRAMIARALAQAFTSHGCAHEYDCCGCRSYSAEAAPLSGDVWRVVVSSSRNY